MSRKGGLIVFTASIQHIHTRSIYTGVFTQMVRLRIIPLSRDDTLSISSASAHVHSRPCSSPHPHPIPRRMLRLSLGLLPHTRLLLTSSSHTTLNTWGSFSETWFPVEDLFRVRKPLSSIHQCGTFSALLPFF